MSEPAASRDAFKLFLVFALIAALFLAVLGILAWNSRFMVMSLPERAPVKPAAPAAPEKALSNNSRTRVQEANVRRRAHDDSGVSGAVASRFELSPIGNRRVGVGISVDYAVGVNSRTGWVVPVRAALPLLRREARA